MDCVFKTPIQKTNERLFFQELCQSIATVVGGTFEIFPYVTGIGQMSERQSIVSDMRSELYFCYLQSNKGYEIVNFSQNGSEDLNLHQVANQGFQVFTHMYVKAGYGVPEDINIWGYRAAFTNAIYQTPR